MIHTFILHQFFPMYPKAVKLRFGTNYRKISNMLEAEVTGMQIQPLKAGGSLELQAARMTPAGLESLEGVPDHGLFVVTEAIDDHGYHNCITQRSQVNPKINLLAGGGPELALVQPQIGDEGLLFSFNGENMISMPPIDEQNIIPVQLWEYRGPAVEVPELSEWLTRQLNRGVKVASASGPWDRRVSGSLADYDNPLRAQDKSPLHPVAYSDVEAVFNKVGESPDATRFRFQVLLGNVGPVKIYQYSGGTINGVWVDQPNPRYRCEVTGIDQRNGTVSPIKPLAGASRLGYRDQKGVFMGTNWLPQGETEIKVGDIFRFSEPVEKVSS